MILPNQTLQTDVPLGLWTDRNTSLFVQCSARVFTSEGVQLHHLPGLSPYLHICFVLPGERTRNFLRCLSLEQTARVGAKDQLCRGHWTRRQTSWIGSSEVNPSTRVMWPYLLELFSETDLLDSSNWNNQIMKPIARPLLTNLWTAFCLVTGESGDF